MLLGVPEGVRTECDDVAETQNPHVEEVEVNGRTPFASYFSATISVGFF